MCYFLFLANSLRWRAVIHGGFNVYSCLECPNQLIYEISSVLWCPLQGQDRQMSLCSTALSVVYVNNMLAHECMERDNLYMFYLFSNFCNVTGCMNAVCHVR